MRPTQYDYDVLVVGASLAGCTAATLFAQRGLRVALVERNPNMQAYKVLCTHSITAVATPIMRKTGLAEKLEAAGALRNTPAIWTEHGWIIDPDAQENFGYNVRRQTIDPLAREIAVRTPGVVSLFGYSAHELLREGRRVTGVRIQHNETKRCSDLTARLIVAADGRHSRIASLAGVREYTNPNKRFGVAAQYRGVKDHFSAMPKPYTHSQLWFRGNDVGYVFPNDGDVTVVVAVVHQDKLDEFKHDKEGSLLRFVEQLPDGPDMSKAERISPVLGLQDLDNIYRANVPPGVALIGDAALSTDPVWGTGCGWAMVSADWLVDCTADALLVQRSVDWAVRSFQRKHYWHTRSHRYHINSFATGRKLDLPERIYFQAAATSESVARRFHLYASRKTGYLQLIAPHRFAQAVWICLIGRSKSRKISVQRLPMQRA